jgi:hypothetical protein
MARKPRVFKVEKINGCSWGADFQPKGGVPSKSHVSVQLANAIDKFGNSWAESLSQSSVGISE